MVKRVMVYAFALALVMGCGKKKQGPSPQEIMDKYRPQLEALRTKIKKAETALPDNAELAPPSKLDPPLSFGASAENDKKGNTIILRYGKLSEPESIMDSEISASDLVFALGWAKEKDAGMDDGKGNPFMLATVARAVETRYLIVLRDEEEVMPELLDEKTFKAGSATARLYLYDLGTEKLIGAIKVVASTPEKLEYTYSSDKTKNDRAMQALFDSVKDDRKVKLGKALKSLGDVVWKRY